MLSKLDTSSITQKGTDILTMLETVSQINTSTDKKYLLIFSDGGDKKDFSSEINFAKENSIVVFILGMGTELGSSIKKKDGSFVKYHDEIVISKLNESIANLAIKTGGVYIKNTTSPKDVKAMFSEIINNSEHKELKTQEIQRYIALFYYPIILAIIILLITFTSFPKNSKHNAVISIVFILTLFTSPSIADMFDFKKLKDAKHFYISKEYNSSSQIYKNYAEKTDNGEAYYNAGNSYYKEGKYLKALSAYSFARLQNKDLRAKKLSNMGNALVRLGTKNTLQRAVKHYEASLRIKEDRFTRENLEAVQKALKDAEKKSDKKNEKDEHKEFTEQKTDENGDDSDEATNTNNKNKNSKNNKGSKSKKSDNKSNSNNTKSSHNQPKDGNGNGTQNSNNNDNGEYFIYKPRFIENKKKGSNQKDSKNNPFDKLSELRFT